MDRLVTDPAALTADWIAPILHEAGASSGATPAGVEVSPVGTGQMASSYRMRFTWADGDTGPASVVVKIGGETEQSRAGGAMGAYPNEYAFYTTWADSITMRIPACLGTAISDDGECFTLVMEDMAPATQGDQIAGCTPAEAALAVENLAGLHGPLWNNPVIHEGILHLSTQEEADLAGRMFADSVEFFIDRYGDRVSADDAETLRAVPEILGSWITGRPERLAITHGDYRLDNVLYRHDADGNPTEAAAVDWQTISLGLPARDVAYFLGNGLTVDDRRAHEREIVERYHRALLDQGVHGYDLHLCWDDYCYAHLQGPLITVFGAHYSTQTDRGDEMFMVMTQRACAAIRDLETIERVRKG